MSDLPTVNGPWRLLVLDGDAADPKWILATVAAPGDVRPAGLADEAPDEVCLRWVAARHGQPVTLTKLPHARCWRVDGAAPR
jgi:hypothetical protein